MVSTIDNINTGYSDNYRIGEKFLEWTDETLSLNEILASVSLYWLTDTFPRAIYPYREVSYPLFLCAPRRSSSSTQRIAEMDLHRPILVAIHVYTDAPWK
jgi:hypothetical protein